MCKVTADGGAFWLHVISAQGHNFLVCAGYPLQEDNLDVIFASGANVDRRCVSSDAYTALRGRRGRRLQLLVVRRPGCGPELLRGQRLDQRLSCEIPHDP